MQQKKRDGFTLIELLVVMAIIGLLAGILIPVISGALESARRASCLNNVKGITGAFLNYAGDHKGRLPAVGSGSSYANFSAVAKMMYKDGYLENGKVWVCPADSGRTVCQGSNFESSFSSGDNCSYLYVEGYSTLKAEELAKKALVADRASGGGKAKMSDRDAHGAKYRNVGYLDGHAATLKDAAVDDIFDSMDDKEVNVVE